MWTFLVVALLGSVAHARRVQTTIEQPATSRTKSLASVLLALQAARTNLNRHVRTQPVRTQHALKDVRISPVHMISAANTAMGDGVVHFSWSEIGSGDIVTQLTKMTGPNVQDMDPATREMTEYNDNFDKFIAAAQSQGAMELLKGSGPFTLLVPVDSSIQENVDVKAHILQGKYSLADLAAGGTAQTLGGTTVEYRKALKTVKVNDASVKAIYNAADHRGGKLSTAFPFDVECTNGVIHAIDEPLVVTNEPLSYTPSAAAPPAGGGAPGSFAEYMASRGMAAPAPAPAPSRSSGSPSFADYMASRGAAAAAGGGAFPVPKDVVWGFEAKKKVFDAWDPEKPRDYNNFNPFERNDESAMADTNGCFPGQSRGYKSPTRPDQSWEIMQKEREAMDALKMDPKFNIKGRPGNFHLSWQKNLGAPP